MKLNLNRADFIANIIGGFLSLSIALIVFAIFTSNGPKHPAPTVHRTAVDHAIMLKQKAHSEAITERARAVEIAGIATKLQRRLEKTERRNIQLERAMSVYYKTTQYSTQELEWLLDVSMWPEVDHPDVQNVTPCESTNTRTAENGSYKGLMQFGVGQLGATRAELMLPVPNLDYSYKWNQLTGGNFAMWACKP